MDGIYISVVIPTYNRAELLKDCLGSLVEQTYKNFEVLVCDDGSTDNSREVAEGFRDRLDIKYFWEPNWGGPARPRNIGIKHAKYDWIAFLDSDDSWYANKLNDCLMHLKEADLIYHDTEIRFKNNMNAEAKYIEGRQLTDNLFRDLFFNSNTISTSSVIASKQALIDVGCFSEDKSIIAYEDYDLWLRLALKNIRFKYLPLILGTYLYGFDNISADGSKILKRELAITNKYRSYISKKEFHQAFNSIHLRHAKRLLNNSNNAANKLFIKVLVNRPNKKQFMQAFGYLIFGRKYKNITKRLKTASFI